MNRLIESCLDVYVVVRVSSSRKYSRELITCTETVSVRTDAPSMTEGCDGHAWSAFCHCVVE